MKITNELKNKIISLKKEGKKNIEIARILDLKVSTIAYWINPESRLKRIQWARTYFLNKTVEQKKEYYQSRRDYTKNYVSNKYKNDPIFREKQKERARICNKKSRMKGGQNG